MTTPSPAPRVASAKASLRAIARRWLMLDVEIKQHDANLEALTAARTSDLLDSIPFRMGSYVAREIFGYLCTQGGPDKCGPQLALDR